MQFETENYKIEIFNYDDFSNSSDYKIIDFDSSYCDTTDYSKAFVIYILEVNTLIKSAIICSNEGGGTDIHKTSVIIENDRLLLCCSYSVFCISIPELALLWNTKADTATCFEIYKYKDRYIVHGELEISMIDRNGKILWQNGGADIFTTIEGKNDFLITENYILATDWENRKYKFDFDGRLIF